MLQVIIVRTNDAIVISRLDVGHLDLLPSTGDAKARSKDLCVRKMSL